MPLNSSDLTLDDVEVGNKYRIIDGFGEGELGTCLDAYATQFGHEYAIIQTGTGTYTTLIHKIANEDQNE